MNLTVPIFPLNLVVFPRSKYPLHIFESRYKKMINKCLTEGNGFGIVANIENKLETIGSYVIIKKVLKKYSTGEMDIIVEGIGRFFLENLRLHDDGYYIAEIKDYHDIPWTIDPILLDNLESKFEDLIEKFNYKLDDAFWNTYRNAERKSFKLAEKSGLTLEQQQELLVLQDENKRIIFLIEHLNKLEKEITESAAVKALILSDGYMN